MANVQVIQRNAHLAGPVRIEFVDGRDGRVAKGTLTAISNSWRSSGDAREEQPTSIQWTLWGAQAENAAAYLERGSHVNVVGRLRNNNYGRDGVTVYGFSFMVDEIDYLDTRAESDARRAAHRGQDTADGSGAQGQGGAFGSRRTSTPSPALA